MSEKNGSEELLRSPAMIRNWHLVLILVIQILGIGIAYGLIRQEVNDTTRRVDAIEQRAVSREDFMEWRQELLDRLDRLDGEMMQIARGQRDK